MKILSLSSATEIQKFFRILPLQRCADCTGGGGDGILFFGHVRSPPQDDELVTVDHSTELVAGGEDVSDAVVAVVRLGCHPKWIDSIQSCPTYYPRFVDCNRIIYETTPFMFFLSISFALVSTVIAYLCRIVLILELRSLSWESD